MVPASIALLSSGCFVEHLHAMLMRPQSGAAVEACWYVLLDAAPSPLVRRERLKFDPACWRWVTASGCDWPFHTVWALRFCWCGVNGLRGQLTALLCGDVHVWGSDAGELPSSRPQHQLTGHHAAAPYSWGSRKGENTLLLQHACFNLP